MRIFGIFLLLCLYACASPKTAQDSFPWHAACEKEAQYVYVEHPQGDYIYDSPAIGIINCGNKDYETQIQNILDSNEGYEDVKRETVIFGNKNVDKNPFIQEIAAKKSDPPISKPEDIASWCAAHERDRYIPFRQYSYWGKCIGYMKEHYPDYYTLYLKQHYSADYQNWRTRSNYSYQHGGASREF